MKLNNRIVVVCGFAVMLTVELLAQSVPSLINYQGRLTDQGGTPFAPGSYGIQFRLWDSLARDSPAGLIWAQQQNVALQANGVFNVILGAAGGSAIPGTTPSVNDLAFAFSSSSRYLGVTIVSSNGLSISTPVEIAPRQQLLSVPFAVMSQQVAQQAMDLLAPPGSVIAFAGDTAPAGWLPCDGRPVSRTDHARLFAAIGIAWGPGDLNSTFNLPDLRGVFLRGWNGSRSDQFADPGDNRTKGNAIGSFQSDQFSSHQHRYSGVEWASDRFNGGYANSSGIISLKDRGTTFAGEGGSAINRTDVVGDGIVKNDQLGSIRPTGGNETRPKNAYVNYIIKY